jgi:hypothetical protein
MWLHMADMAGIGANLSLENSSHTAFQRSAAYMETMELFLEQAEVGRG